MSYFAHFGLKQEPFSNAPVSQFYYNSASHAQALERLTYVVSQAKGLALLVGDVGAGKSTLARRLLDSLAEDEYEAALLVIIHSGITAQWLLKRIALQLGVEEPSDEKLTLLGQLYQRLLTIHESGRKAVLLIDEAQMLENREVMEEFRGLLNLELPEHKLLTIVLFGLPELEQHLKLDPPLDQRVSLKTRLQPLSAEATEAYIKHRLKIAGATRMPFSAEAVAAVHRFTGGIPRLINTLCDNCLFEGATMKRSLVNADLVRLCATDFGLVEGPTAQPPPTGAAHPAARPVVREAAAPPVTRPAPRPAGDQNAARDPAGAAANGTAADPGDLERFLSEGAQKA